MFVADFDEEHELLPTKLAEEVAKLKHGFPLHNSRLQLCDPALLK